MHLAWCNLDFEHELASLSKIYTPLPMLLELSQRWSDVMRLLPEAREAEFLEPGTLPPAKVRGDVERFIPWGFTPRVAEFTRGLRALKTSFPPVELVRELNDKRFSHQLEKEFQLDLPFSRVVSSISELLETVRDCPFDWVLKHPLGFSARERMVGRRGQLFESAQGWAQRKFRQGWTLLFEPWVEQRSDYSVHFQIEPRGRIRLVGCCELVGDPGGVYRGNRVVVPHSLDHAALKDAQRVAERLAQRGYHGPVGIDAFRGRLGEQTVTRPLVEINARYSFGRLALALADWVPSGWSYLWWHPSRAEAQTLDFSTWSPLPNKESPQPGSGIYGLPLLADPKGLSQTLVVLAPTKEELAVREMSLRSRHRGARSLCPLST